MMSLGWACEPIRSSEIQGDVLEILTKTHSVLLGITWEDTEPGVLVDIFPIHET